MRHATTEDLQPIEPILVTLRAIAGMAERGPGRFYRRGSAFLHFHAENSLLFADLKQEGQWVRHALRTRRDAASLIAMARQIVAAEAQARTPR